MKKSIGIFLNNMYAWSINKVLPYLLTGVTDPSSGVPLTFRQLLQLPFFVTKKNFIESSALLPHLMNGKVNSISIILLRVFKDPKTTFKELLRRS